MRILIPILGFGRTGGYRVLSRLASEWKAVGHEVAFVAPCRGDAPYHPTTASTIWLDDRGHSTERSELSPRGGITGVARDLYALWAGLNRYGTDADLVVANHSLTAWPVAFARLRGAKAYYVQAYEPEYFTAKGIGPRALMLWALAVGSYWLSLRRVANSPLYHRYKFLRAAASVPPGIDFGVFSPAGDARPREGSLTLGCIGRAEPDKGTRYALNAYRELLARGRDVQMRVAYGGVGDDERRLDGLTVTVPENDRALGDYYRSLDVLIAPGLVQHGAPHYPVMEAMACGVPVVTTGYLPATPSNARIVPVRDALAIADAVDAIADDRNDARHRARLGIEATRQFHWPVVADALLRAFAVTG
ncbi:MAG: hypothetical protein JWM95_3590 [Gemmatimonadetes bacterium]|nr:hypothetical protein [Gemmatimonadota bacterium]